MAHHVKEHVFRWAGRRMSASRAVVRFELAPGALGRDGHVRAQRRFNASALGSGGQTRLSFRGPGTCGLLSVPDVFGAERSWGSVQACGLFGARYGVNIWVHVPHRHRSFVAMDTRGIRIHRMDRRDEANHSDRIRSGHQGAAGCCLHFRLRSWFSSMSLKRGHRCRVVAVKRLVLYVCAFHC